MSHPAPGESIRPMRPLDPGQAEEDMMSREISDAWDRLRQSEWYRLYVAGKDAAFEGLRRDWRHRLLVTGHGRSGKDTLCQLLSSVGVLSPRLYVYNLGSLSYAASPIIGAALGVPPNEAYATRHDHSDFWFDFLNRFRMEEGPTALIRLALSRTPSFSPAYRTVRDHTETRVLCLNGSRNFEEWTAAVNDRTLTDVVWVDGCSPCDPTLDYTSADFLAFAQSSMKASFHWLVNTFSKPELQSKATRLLDAVRRPRRSDGRPSSRNVIQFCD